MAARHLRRSSGADAGVGAVLAVLRPGRLLAAEALERATSIARARRLDLRVLCVVPSGATAERVLRAAARAEQWVRERTGSGSPPPVVVRGGDAVAAATAVASDVGASLLVVGAPPTAVPRWVALTRRLGYPVLLARSARGGAQVVAATDLLDPRLPTLIHAMRVAVPRGCRVTIVHDVDEGAVPPADREARARRLIRIAEAAPSSVEVEAVLASGADVASAVAQAARKRGADLVVVGVHCPGPAPGERAPHQNATRIAALVDRSVLLVPLPPPSWLRRRGRASSGGAP